MSLAGTETKTADAGDDDTVYIDGKPFKRKALERHNVTQKVAVLANKVKSTLGEMVKGQ
eukprot:CAMPEP_0174971914 /NCGR_PEP_ID=MMETSP0004_2-20121128/10306_1 /TAXON_ID=420556 /ORGANISM="Ochromonas sp., Strain CCMP1393" /LENGTH=58 /DNA_ID=CAMNT_0016222015 /DNA_START=25 /DNA_END=201 /DNA_ORIENTATION=+